MMMSSGMGSLSDAPQDSWYTQAIRTATSLAEMDNFDFRADDPFSKSFAPTYRITKVSERKKNGFPACHASEKLFHHFRGALSVPD